VPLLCEEIKETAVYAKQNNLKLKTVYIGGGTPTTLSAKQLDEIIQCINESFDLSFLLEFTVEAGRPDTVTSEKLQVLKNHGVSRISINPQTLNDEVLQVIGRAHTKEQFMNAFNLAREIGFNNINTDLIAGLPGESAKSFINSVNDVSALSPENITIHAFTLKKSSNYRMGGDTSFKTEVETANKMTDYACAYLNSRSYTPYYVYRQKNTVGNLENVGYSKKGFESIYNIIMMGEYHTVFGAGAGSVTKIVTDGGSHVDRIFAPKYPYEFLDDNKYSGFDMNKVIDLLEKR
jgi:oxygen-independent coproporphyrinogen-3 oxidase